MWRRFCSPRSALSRLAAESLGGSSESGGTDAWRERTPEWLASAAEKAGCTAEELLEQGGGYAHDAESGLWVTERGDKARYDRAVAREAQRKLAEGKPLNDEERARVGVVVDGNGVFLGAVVRPDGAIDGSEVAEGAGVREMMKASGASWRALAADESAEVLEAVRGQFAAERAKFNISGIYTGTAATVQTETPQFKSWFGDWEKDPENASKVVDRAGRPRIVYHGTPNGRFWTFDKTRIGETWNADETGFFFTSSRSQAEEYMKPYFRENTADPNLLAVYLSIKNPLVIDGAWWQKNFGRSDIYNHDAIEIWDTEKSTILEAMRQGGHDGVIIDPNPMGGYAKMYMVPEPTQIKSATDNTGAFSPRNPDMRYSIRGRRGAENGIIRGDGGDEDSKARFLVAPRRIVEAIAKPRLSEVL